MTVVGRPAQAASQLFNERAERTNGCCTPQGAQPKTIFLLPLIWKCTGILEAGLTHTTHSHHLSAARFWRTAASTTSLSARSASLQYCSACPSFAQAAVQRRRSLRAAGGRYFRARGLLATAAAATGETAAPPPEPPPPPPPNNSELELERRSSSATNLIASQSSPTAATATLAFARMRGGQRRRRDPFWLQAARAMRSSPRMKASPPSAVCSV